MRFKRLKICSKLCTLGVLLPLLPSWGATTYRLGEDFSSDANPNGPWTYGYVPAKGHFTPFPAHEVGADDNGVPVPYWFNPITRSAIFYNPHPNTTVISYGGEGVHPPHSVWCDGEPSDVWQMTRSPRPRPVNTT
jgi:hypothetical protein